MSSKKKKKNEELEIDIAGLEDEDAIKNDEIEIDFEAENYVYQ
jgi:hypothetical protein